MHVDKCFMTVIEVQAGVGSAERAFKVQDVLGCDEDGDVNKSTTSWCVHCFSFLLFLRGGGGVV